MFALLLSLIHPNEYSFNLFIIVMNQNVDSTVLAPPHSQFISLGSARQTTVM